MSKTPNSSYGNQVSYHMQEKKGNQKLWVVMSFLDWKEFSIWSFENVDSKEKVTKHQEIISRAGKFQFAQGISKKVLQVIIAPRNETLCNLSCSQSTSATLDSSNETMKHSKQNYRSSKSVSSNSSWEEVIVFSNDFFNKILKSWLSDWKLKTMVKSYRRTRKELMRHHLQGKLCKKKNIFNNHIETCKNKKTMGLTRNCKMSSVSKFR